MRVCDLVSCQDCGRDADDVAHVSDLQRLGWDICDRVRSHAIQCPECKAQWRRKGTKR